MSKPDGGPAFPSLLTVSEWNETAAAYIEHRVPVGGMSLRDHFAGQAISAFLHLTDDVIANVEASAERAYAIADAMIAERSKP